MLPNQSPVDGSILQIGGGGVVNNAADFNMGGTFRLGVGGDSDTSGSYVQTGGNVTVANILYIGDVGAGHLTLGGSANMTVNGETSRLGSAGNPSTITLEGDAMLTLVDRIDIGRGNLNDAASVLTIRDNATFNVANDLVLGGWTDDNGHLEMSGGTLNAGWLNWGWGAKASVNITGGQINAAGYLWAGIDPTASFNGVQSAGSVNLGGFALFNRASSYELSGGEFHAGDWMALGNTNDSQVTFTQTNGAVTIDGSGLWIGQGAVNTHAVYSISGGTLDITTGRIDISANGVFRVEGSAAEINAINYGHGGVLELVLDELGGLSVINIADTASIREGATIVADFSAYAYAEGETWDVLSAATVENFANLVLDGPSDIALRLVDTDNGQVIQMYAIPEPASLVLLSAGAVLMLRRRK